MATVDPGSPSPIQNMGQSGGNRAAFPRPAPPLRRIGAVKMDERFKAETFQKLGLEGSSKDWETLAKGKIMEWEEDNSGISLFHFDSDEDILYLLSICR